MSGSCEQMTNRTFRTPTMTIPCPWPALLWLDLNLSADPLLSFPILNTSWHGSKLTPHLSKCQIRCIMFFQSLQWRHRRCRCQPQQRRVLGRWWCQQLPGFRTTNLQLQWHFLVPHVLCPPSDPHRHPHPHELHPLPRVRVEVVAQLCDLPTPCYNDHHFNSEVTFTKARTRAITRMMPAVKCSDVADCRKVVVVWITIRSAKTKVQIDLMVFFKEKTKTFLNWNSSLLTFLACF